MTGTSLFDRVVSALFGQADIKDEAGNIRRIELRRGADASRH